MNHSAIAYWVYRVTKRLILIAIIFALVMPYVQAQENYKVSRTVAQNGSRLISIRSNINYHAYCYILDGNGRMVVDFYLNPYASSRWYYEPYGHWIWRCE